MHNSAGSQRLQRENRVCVPLDSRFIVIESPRAYAWGIIPAWPGYTGLGRPSAKPRPGSSAARTIPCGHHVHPCAQARGFVPRYSTLMDPSNFAPTHPGLTRRLAAVAYDTLLLSALLLLAGGPLPFISPSIQELWWVRLLIQGYLLTISFAFFGWFWVHGGQTIGMRAWRIRLVQDNGTPVGWRQAAVRFLSALLSWAALGLGFLWVIVDSSNRAWHDYLSKTHLILVPKNTAGREPAYCTKDPG